MRGKTIFLSNLNAGSPLCALFAVLMIVGCASFSFPFVEPGPDPVATPAAQYRAYGDSVTYGTYLSNPATQSFPSLVAEFEKVSFANNALAGDQACDVPTAQIFPNEDSPTLAQHPTYTLLIGSNDFLTKGTGPYEAIFMLCHQATISWLAIPTEYKVMANGSGMTTTGPGGIDTSNNWNSWTTGGLGASVSFTITTNAVGPIYAWPRIEDNNPATYTYSLDGVSMGSASVQTSPEIATRNGGFNSLGFLRFAPVSAGKHVVTFTQTSGDARGVSVVGIGTPQGQVGDQFPIVLVGTIPFLLRGQDMSCDSANGPCEQYIQDIEKDVDLFSGDGLNVRLFDTRKFMFGTSAEMIDAYHPNEFGQLELSHAVESVW